MKRSLFLTFMTLTILTSTILWAEEKAETKKTAEPKTIRLLTVGNSFADNALSHLPRIVKASGNKLIYAKANLGGCSLERHWQHVEKYEADHNDKGGKPYDWQGKKYSLSEMLTLDKWDVVTIQQVSWKSHDVATYRPYAKKLQDYIKKHAPQAKVLIQQVWAYRVDDPRFSPNNKKPNEPHTHKAMYEQVREVNHIVAKELGIEILPSGDAMYLADIDPKWGYKPDAKFDAVQAKPPLLPDQTHSLHGGHQWVTQKGKTDLRMDGHHANGAGQYLIGCVWYEVLYGQSVVDNQYTPQKMNPAYAQFLRQTAHKAVKNLETEKK